MNEKAALRRALRSAYPGDEERNRQSAALQRHVLAWAPFQRAACVGGYVPLRREADVLPLLREVLRRGSLLALPRVESEGVMTLRHVASLEALVPGAYGIPEPPADAPLLAPERLSLLLVPLEGIDPAGMRLGEGGGYYDRLLAQTDCPTLGMVMGWQWAERIPAEPWDRPLYAAADQHGIHLFQTQERMNHSHGKEQKEKDRQAGCQAVPEG